MSHASRIAPALALALAGLVSILCASPVWGQSAPPTPITVGRLTITGFIQTDAIFAPGADKDSGEPPDTFSVPRARIGLGGDVTSKISWYLQGDFASLTNDGRVLRDAYVQVMATPQLVVRVGQFVAPFSLERLTSYSKLELIDRSVVGVSLAPSRDIGLMVLNARPWRGWLTYGGAIINGAGQNALDNNSAKDLVGRVAARIPPIEGLSVGFNAQTGEQPQGDRHRLGVDVNLERPQYRVAVERVAQSRHFSTTLDTTGYTVIGAYRHPAPQVTPHYAGYELAARYVDVDDDGVALDTHQVQAGGTYFVTPQLRVQSNLVVPIGDDQPRHTLRWWSRLQFNF